MKNIETKIPLLNGSPAVAFPLGFQRGWADPEIEDGTIPLYIAEAYIAKVALPEGLRHTFPFTKLPITAEGWKSYREAYYAGNICTNPFGYRDGKKFAPWGLSVHGMPKLRPQDI